MIIKRYACLLAAASAPFPTLSMNAILDMPVVGGVTATSAKIQVRSRSPGGEVEFQVCTDPTFLDLSTCITGSMVTTTASSPNPGVDPVDCTAIATVTGLQPSTIYHHRLIVDGKPRISGIASSFMTFPNPTEHTSFAAVITADAGNNIDGFWYKSALAENPLFMMQIGDFPHRDPRSPDDARKMNINLKCRSGSDCNGQQGAEFALNCLSKMSFDHTWDDHDYCGQDSDGHCEYREEFIQIYKDHWPTYDLPGEGVMQGSGIWHSFDVGKVKFIVLDLRSNRDSNDCGAGGSHPCHADGKTMLGPSQKAWLKDTVLSAKDSSDFIVIVSSINTNNLAREGSDDTWNTGFPAEAAELRAFFESNTVTNVVFLTGDIHTGGAIDDGSNSQMGQPEMNVAHTGVPDGIGLSRLGTWSVGAWLQKDVRSPNNEFPLGYSVVKYELDAELGEFVLKLVCKGTDGVERVSATLRKGGTLHDQFVSQQS